MSKSSTASKVTPLPQKSAWAKGPPTASTSLSQSPSPAPTPSHSRRPSALGPPDAVAAAVSVPRAPKNANAGPVSFGSIDGGAAPNAAPPQPPKSSTDSVRSFGSVSVPANGRAPSPAPGSARPRAKMDVKKLFQTPSSGSQPPSTSSSPASTSSAPPPQQPPPQQAPYSPHAGFRVPPQPQQQQPPPPQQGQQHQGQGSPRSPAYARANGARPAPPQQPLGSPQPGPPPQMHMPPGAMVSMPVPGWPGYYYPAPEHQPQHYGGMPYSPGTWGYPPPQPPPPGQQPQPYPPPPHQQQHQPHPHTPHQHPQALSPRTGPAPLTPTPAHAQAHHHSHSLSVGSPPPTPSTPASAARLNQNASAFVPGTGGGRGSKISIKRQDGADVSLEELRALQGQGQGPAPSSASASPGNGANRKSIVRLESEEARRKRVKEEEEKARKEREMREAEERRRKEEEEAKVKKAREEEERIRREKEEEEARVRREEEERVRKAREEEERERIRKEKEAEEARLKAEEEERERERVKEKEAEEARLKAEAEEKARLEAEAAAKAAAAAEAAAERAAAEEKERLRLEAEAALAKEKEEAEDGEIAPSSPSASAKPPTPTPTAAPSTSASTSAPKEPSKLRLDTSTPLPTKDELAGARRRPGPLDLSQMKRQSEAVPAPLPSALATARVIENLEEVKYPEGVASPKVELNRGVKDGKFRYDRDFLLQFMSVCKEKPDMLPPLDAIGLEPVAQHHAMQRGGSGRNRTASGAGNMGPPSLSRQNSVGLGISAFGKAGPPNPFSMGNFATPPVGKSSEDRFAAANRAASVGGAMPFGATGRAPAPMTRSASQGGPGTPTGSNRTRSKRGEKRNEANRVPPPPQGGHGHGHHGPGGFGQSQLGPGGQMLEPVAPLQKSENRWTANVGRKAAQQDEDSPEMVDRKVKALLNKLTMERFDSISDQIITWANKSERESDGRTLIRVIRLVFEKATDEAAWGEMYARLCRKMMEQISPGVQDEGIKNAEGRPIAGGQLFRKYLLNRCQEDFERGWMNKEVTAAAARTKATEDQAAKAANDKAAADAKAAGDDGKAGEVELYSEEYYAAQKAKRQGLGLIKFIGELFKLQMLTERIMHECIKKLLGNVENPEEEEIESLCKLLSTVGAILDTPKAKAHMDVYFSRMKELARGDAVSSRMQFMLQDVIELRDRRWQTRNAVAAPATLAQIHEAAAKEKAQADKESYQRNVSMSRGGSRRGNPRDGPGDAQVGPDGWTTAGTGPTRPPPKAGDLSKFGQINKAAPMTFGPTSVFAKKDPKQRSESLSRTNSSANMFSMLSQGGGEPEAKAAQGEAAPAPQRKKLQLLPRSKPTEDSTPAASEGTSDDGADDAKSEAAGMSEAEAKKRVAEDAKEFFGVRNLDEAEDYFAKLPPEHRFRLVDTLVAGAIEAKAADAELVGAFFARAAERGLCAPQAFEDGFGPTAEVVDDIAIDAPKAFDLFATMVKGAGLDKDEERRGRIVEKSGGSEKLLGLLS